MNEDFGADSGPLGSPWDEVLTASAKSVDSTHFSWTNIPHYTFNYAMSSEQRIVPWQLVRHDSEATAASKTTSIRKEPEAALTVSAVSSAKSVDIRLTRRQRDVLNLIVQGMSNKEIARSLKLGEGTVKIHIAALFGKLGVRRRAAVAAAASRFLSLSKQAIT